MIAKRFVALLVLAMVAGARESQADLMPVSSSLSLTAYADVHYVPVSQGRKRTASGPAGEDWPVGTVVTSWITRESRAERSFTPSG